jgi:hypothetical protein
MRKMPMMLSGLVVSFFLSACSSSNPYMTRGTDEFGRVTSHLLGTWNVTSYSAGGAEKIGPAYRAGKVVFEEPESGRQQGKVNFTIPLSRGVVKSMTPTWKEAAPNIAVNNYNLVVTANWAISRDGEIIYIHHPLVRADISGKGKDINALIGWENGKLLAASHASNGGSLESSIASNIIKQTSGVGSYYPEIPRHVDFKLSGNKLQLTGTSGISLKMER